MTVKRLVFIRPAETNWNRFGRWQGWVNIPINAHGREQAARLAKFLRNIGMQTLYSSDLRRAHETAAIVGQALGVAPVLDARLRERNVGVWQGLTSDELRDWYPDEYQQLLSDPLRYVVPGGESRAQLLSRVNAAFDEITAQATGETVGILSHSTAIKALLHDLIPDYDERDLVLENTSVTSLARTDNGWTLTAANDVLHLEGLEAISSSELED